MAQRYDTYKDSGVQWLGEIPSHWKSVRLKYTVTVNDDTLSQETSPDTIIDYVEIGDVVYSKGITTHTKYKFEDAPSRARRKTQKGDVIISTVRTYLRAIAKIEEDNLIVSTGFAVLRPKSIDGEFLSYSTFSNYFVDYVVSESKGMSYPAINTDKLVSSHIALPPLPEQHSIVAYLGDKCAKIDEWIEKKEKEVELLGEMKQRVIADAVTRGLNPNVKMKPAKNSFFGMIPNHWEEIKMKYLFNERSEKNHPDEISLCATQTYGVIPQKLYCSYGHRVVEVSKGFELLKFVKEGDFVIHLRSFQGGIEYAYYQGIISPAYTILEPRDKRNTMYFKYLFKSYNYIQLLKTCVTGIREGQNINYSLLGKKHIPVPPISEQQEIVAYINDKTSKIDTLVAKVTKEIEHLKEYKQRLISDVVTGQVKVC